MGQLTSIRCYACTTMNVDRLLSDVYDATWRRWLANVRFVPKSQQCDDFFEPELALRSGVRNQACNNGVCMKMWFKGNKGNNHIWRGCISKTQKQVRPDCTRILSSEGTSRLLFRGSKVSNVC
uniref:Zf-RVT domain-containing protein n=1 Tax=Ascaris lumbricoides TaxID=6252 RepID=A0A0M3HND8_ASCLU